MKTSVNSVRSGFSMIELVFVIVILGVLAAVAVPRFVATRTDAQVATARSDLASVQKAIVAKVFADNIDATVSTPTDPNQAWTKGAKLAGWGEWIMQVGGLDGGRWKVGGKQMTGFTYVAAPEQNDQIEPVGNTTLDGGGKGKGGCGGVLGIAAAAGGYMVFAPNNSGTGTAGSGSTGNDFCAQLRESYKSSGGPGNKVIPLASSGTVEF